MKLKLSMEYNIPFTSWDEIIRRDIKDKLNDQLEK